MDEILLFAVPVALIAGIAALAKPARDRFVPVAKAVGRTGAAVVKVQAAGTRHIIDVAMHGDGTQSGTAGRTASTAAKTSSGRTASTSAKTSPGRAQGTAAKTSSGRARGGPAKTSAGRTTRGPAKTSSGRAARGAAKASAGRPGRRASGSAAG